MKELEQANSGIIEELQSKIQALENENRRLKERLDEAGVSYADIAADENAELTERYDPDQGARIRKFEVTDKNANAFTCYWRFRTLGLNVQTQVESKNFAR